MLGRQERWQEDLFVAGPLRDLVPDDHILKRVDRVLDLAWLREEVSGLYDTDRGRPGIDPEAAVRLMLAGLFLNIVHDRKLMREAQVNLAIRWFAGFRLTDALPDHSSLTRIRQRWGEDRFKMIFQKSVNQCVKAGLVRGDIAHIDATLIRADVSWESLVERHLNDVKSANGDADDSQGENPNAPPGGGSACSRAGNPKKYSTTDPDATLATSCKQYRMEPCYKQHTAADDKAGVIVDVHVTTGEASEGRELEGQLDRIEQTTGRKVQTATTDAGYAHAANFAMLEAREVEAIIPPQKIPHNGKTIPAQRFRYDAKHEMVRCPQGKKLVQRSRDAKDHGWVYRARTSDCRECSKRTQCVPPSSKVRVIRIGDGHESLLRARRRRERWDQRQQELYRRHRWRVEGVHGEAKTCHGLRRAVRRRLWNIRIQAYLTAAVMNLKRLATLWRARGTPYAMFIALQHEIIIFCRFTWQRCADYSLKTPRAA